MGNFISDTFTLIKTFLFIRYWHNADLLERRVRFINDAIETKRLTNFPGKQIISIYIKRIAKLKYN